MTEIEQLKTKIAKLEVDLAHRDEMIEALKSFVNAAQEAKRRAMEVIVAAAQTSTDVGHIHD